MCMVMTSLKFVFVNPFPCVVAEPRNRIKTGCNFRVRVCENQGLSLQAVGISSKRVSTYSLALVN